MKRPASFVESSQQNLTEQQIPDAIVDFFEAYMLCCQHLAGKEPASLESDRSAGPALPHLEVSRILRFWTVGRHRPAQQDARRSIATFGHGSFQGLMRAHVVVFGLKVVEAVLLVGEGRFRGGEGSFAISPLLVFS